MPTKSLSDRQHNDLTAISNQGSWPQWPYLPLKRRNTAHLNQLPFEIGLLFSLTTPDVGPIRVYKANLFGLCEDGLDHVQYLEYPSASALLADGWEVD